MPGGGGGGGAAPMSVVVHAVGHSRFSLGPSDFPNLSFRRVMWASEKSGVAAAVQRDNAAATAVDAAHRFASSQPISPISPVTPLIVRPTLQYATVLAKGAWHDAAAVTADVEEELATINSGAAAEGVSVSPMPPSLLSPDAEIDEEVAAATAVSALSPSESEAGVGAGAGASVDADGSTVAAQALVEQPSRVPTPVAAIIDALPEPELAVPEPVVAQPEPQTDAKSQPEAKTKSKKSKTKGRPADAVAPAPVATPAAVVPPLAVQVQEEPVSIAEPVASTEAAVPVAVAAAAVASPQSKAAPAATPKPKKKKAAAAAPVAAAPTVVATLAPMEAEAEPEPEHEIEEEAPAPAPTATVTPAAAGAASSHMSLALFGAFIVVLIALSVLVPPARALLLPLSALLVVAVGAARHPEGRSKVPPAVMQLLDQCGLLETDAPPHADSATAHTPRRSPKKGKHKSRR